MPSDPRRQIFQIQHKLQQELHSKQREFRFQSESHDCQQWKQRRMYLFQLERLLACAALA